jgi:hypothetical protein
LFFGDSGGADAEQQNWLKTGGNVKLRINQIIES